MKKIFIILIVSIVTFFSVNPSFCATYYVDSTRPDDNGNGLTKATAKKYINSGCMLLASGDKLIVCDGLYTNDNDYVENVASGTSDNYTEIVAENDFGVTIERGYRQYHPTIHLRSKHYVRIRGFIVHPQGTMDRSVYIGGESDRSCSFIEIIRVGGQYGIADGFSNHILYEECWAWGGANYHFQSYRSNNITYRRCFARHDERLDGDSKPIYASYVPQAAFCIYNTNDVIMENCIAIDGQQYSNERPTDFQITANDYDERSSNNGRYYGCISLNATGSEKGDNPDYAQTVGFYLDVKYDAIDTIYENCISWGSSNTAFAINKGTNTILRNCLMSSLGSGLNNTTNSTNTIVENAMIINNGGYGVYRGDTDNSLFYNNALGNSNNGTQLNSITIDPNLLYPVKIEATSAAKEDGKDGLDRGANVIYRYEKGILTTKPLWPFPNEDVIRNDIYTNEGYHRDWTASGQSLTEYIWGYIGGNTLPPFNVVVEPGNAKAYLSWDANKYNDGVTNYNIYKESVSGNYDLYTTVDSNTTNALITGLTNDNEYNFVVRTVAAVAESGDSYKVSTTPRSSIPPAPPVGIDIKQAD